MSERPVYPYASLGKYLQTQRHQLHESLAEVSGAVEIDTDVMAQIESGQMRPSEDILMLLISHFDMDDVAADKLWDLAGYSRKKAENLLEQIMDEIDPKQILMVMPFDNRTVYSDDVRVSVDDKGAVITFLQAGLNGQSASVARIGMSKEQTRSVAEAILHAIEEAEKPYQPKLLAAPKIEQNPQSK